MNKPYIYIDSYCYSHLMDFMNESHPQDLKGEIYDLNVFYDDLWLKDSAVIEHLRNFRGNWIVSLVFAFVDQPLRFIMRRITTCTTKSKATITAEYMRRLAAKDQRGTLKIKEESFNFYLN